MNRESRLARLRGSTSAEIAGVGAGQRRQDLRKATLEAVCPWELAADGARNFSLLGRREFGWRQSG